MFLSSGGKDRINSNIMSFVLISCYVINKYNFHKSTFLLFYPFLYNQYLLKYPKMSLYLIYKRHTKTPPFMDSYGSSMCLTLCVLTSSYGTLQNSRYFPLYRVSYHYYFFPIKFTVLYRLMTKVIRSICNVKEDLESKTQICYDYTTQTFYSSTTLVIVFVCLTIGPVILRLPFIPTWVIKTKSVKFILR